MPPSITKISRLRDCRVFRDFRWGDDPTLEDFARFNLIYGWNGSGKSTISQLLRNLELREPPGFGDVRFAVDGHDISGDQFTTTPPEGIAIRVFNQQFVQANVFRSDGGNITPILVVGQKSVVAQQQAEDLRTAQSTLHQSLERAQREADDLKKRLDRHCTDNAKTLKDRIGEKAGSAYRNYNNPRYAQRADRMLAERDADAHRLSEPDRSRLTAHQNEDAKETIPLSEERFPQLRTRQDAVVGLLSQTVTSRAIRSLVDDPVLAGWVQRGLDIHSERNSQVCLYCDQPTPDSRLTALNGHFDQAHEQLMRQIDDEIERCNSAISDLIAIESNLPEQGSLYADLTAAFEEAKATLVEHTKEAKTFLDKLVDQLNAKRGRPFAEINLASSAPLIEGDALSRVGTVIQQHNEKCSDFDAGVRDARLRLEADFIADHLAEYKELKTAIQRRRLSMQEASQRAEQNRAEIERLERQVLDHRLPADSLNNDLREYLGPGQLQVEVKEQGYTLVRGGVPAEDPSEGEMTAIALLYFLRSLDSSTFDLSNGVVVLDDPVSSLDANALYIASGFIRRHTEHAGQLFILTHNFTFFREMRHWFKHLRGQRKRDPRKRPARFYMLRCIVQNDVRNSRLRKLDPLLEHYESDYHYLFSRIYQATSSPNEDLEDNYALPNMARRLLEAFLAFRQPQASDLKKRLDAVRFDGAKKTLIERFVNVYSHNAILDTSEHDPSVLSETNSVLQHLMDLIETVDKEHFDAMVAASNQALPSEDDE